MSGAEKQKHSLEIPVIYRKAFLLFKDNLNLFLPFGLIYGMGGVAYRVMSKAFSTGVPSDNILIPLFLDVIFATLANIMVIYSAWRIYKGEEVPVYEVLNKAFLKYGVCLLATLFSLSIVFSGLLLFILPGIYFATVYSFVIIFIVIEGSPLFWSFSLSIGLARKAFARVLVFSLIMPVIFLALYSLAKEYFDKYPTLVYSVTLALTAILTPLGVIAQVILFCRMKENFSREIL
ncbi:MAG: hypothetical protein HQL27_10090 [Candidatus Omnitrophica bacterium]|nr:hypothetical protein [Candidatus Omnitrophota bacterium]